VHLQVEVRSLSDTLTVSVTIGTLVAALRLRELTVAWPERTVPQSSTFSSLNSIRPESLKPQAKAILACGQTVTGCSGTPLIVALATSSSVRVPDSKDEESWLRFKGSIDGVKGGVKSAALKGPASHASHRGIGHRATGGGP